MTDDEPTRAQLYVTFGTQYAREPHPSGLTWIHPDGWLTVDYPITEAYPKDHLNAYERARLTVWQYLNGAYAFDYSVEPGREWYPDGELARMVLP